MSNQDLCQQEYIQWFTHITHEPREALTCTTSTDTLKQCLDTDTGFRFERNQENMLKIVRRAKGRPLMRLCVNFYAQRQKYILWALSRTRTLPTTILAAFNTSKNT